MQNDLNNAVGYATIWSAVIPTLALFGSLYAYFRKKKENNVLTLQNIELNNLNPNLDVLDNYAIVWEKMKEIFSAEFKEGNPTVVKNIGLDLEKILPDLGDFIAQKSKNNSTLNFKYLGLIINPQSPLINSLINGKSNIQTEFVQSSFRRLHVLENQFANNNSINFEIVSYDIPPVLHGVMINDKHLFLGFTEMHDGKIFGSDKPYIYLKFNPEIEATNHYFTMYKNWFNFQWSYGA